jgi:hypothetical protein
MTYDESANLMQDVGFLGRVKVACLKYATYILDEDPSVTAHNTRMRWAINTQQNPDSIAFGLRPPVVMDAGVQSAGSAIEDTALQSSVETVINKLL